jgi:hypothetical protein
MYILFYVCDICDFETVQKQCLSSLRQNNHKNLLDNESDDDDHIQSPTYHFDLCRYSVMYTDNVAFHCSEAGLSLVEEEKIAKVCQVFFYENVKRE